MENRKSIVVKDKLDLRRLVKPGSFSNVGNGAALEEIRPSEAISSTSILFMNKTNNNHSNDSSCKSPGGSRCSVVSKLSSRASDNESLSSSSLNSLQKSRDRKTLRKTKNEELAEALARAYEIENRLKKEVKSSARVVRMTEKVLKECDKDVAATKEKIVHNLEEANAKLQALVADTSTTS